MNYIKPEDIKEYINQNPTGIAGMSEELSAMVNHFAESIVRECCNVLQTETIRHNGYGYNQGALHKKIKDHFGVA